MKKECLFEVFAYIDDAFIVEAATYRRSRKPVTWVFYAGIAAAFLAVAGVFFLVRSTVMKTKSTNPESGLEETVPFVTSTEATVAVTSPAIVQEQVLFAPDESAGYCQDEMVGASAGEIMLPHQLKQEIEKTENRDKYFAVTIMVCRFEYVDQYCSDEDAKYEACAKDPMIALFNQEFGHWLYDIYLPQYTKEEQWAIEKQDDLGEICLEEIFIEEYWSKTQTKETQDEYLEAKRRFEEIQAAYPDRVSGKRLIELFGDRIKEDVQKEMERLLLIGYSIEMIPLPEVYDNEYYVLDGQYGYHVYNGFTVTGYLTGEQLSNFKADPTHGYRFTWNTEDGKVDVGDE